MLRSQRLFTSLRLEHELFADVLMDGGESDLDLGNYERYVTTPYIFPSDCRLTLLCKILGP